MRGLLAAAVVAGAFAGCGHDRGEPARTTAPRTTPQAASPQQPAPPADSQPHGRLSKAEYRSIAREYDLIASIRDSTDGAAVLAAFKRACTALRVPDTLLMRRVQADCEVGKQLIESLTAVRSAPHACRAGPPDCISRRYYELGTAIARSVSSGLDLNRELLRRGIGGPCARAIGMPSAQGVALSKAARAANAAALAIDNERLAAYRRAAKELEAGLRGGNQHDPNVVIRRSCPHTGAGTPRKRRGRHGGGIRA